MIDQINDLRVATAYKKQFMDKFKLDEKDFLIDAKSKWINFEVEFTLDNHKFHPYIRYENKNVNTPRVMDISLLSDDTKILYPSKYVESSKVSEVSIHNVIEMCKNMKFEMMCIESAVSEWMNSPTVHKYDCPELKNDELWSKYGMSGSLSQNGFSEAPEYIGPYSDEFKKLYREHLLILDLMNTIPSVNANGRDEEVLVNSYHLKHMLERIDSWRGNKNSYFSNGGTIMTVPYFLNDRFGSMDRVKNIKAPNCDIVIPKLVYYTLEAIDNKIGGK